MQLTHSTIEEDVEVYINNRVKTRSATSRKLKEISNAISMDSDFQEVIHLSLNGWPKKEDRLNRGVKPYLTHRNHLSVHKIILYFQDRIVIPQNLRAEMQWSIHTGHLGLNKCRERAEMSAENIPGNRWFHQKIESLKPTPLPDRPMAKSRNGHIENEWGILLSRDRLFLPLLGNGDIKSTNKKYFRWKIKNSVHPVGTRGWNWKWQCRTIHKHTF